MVLANYQYQGLISILTKSPLVLKDIAIFKKIKNISVGLAITSLDDSISNYLEFRALLSQQRLIALKKLEEAGIKTYAFVGPLLQSTKKIPKG